MKSKTFDQIVENRANERARERIRQFKVAVSSACKSLVGENRGYVGTTPMEKDWYPDFKKVLSILASNDNSKGWPSKIWEEEREKVTTELLHIMDEMQRALLSTPPADDDPKPEGAEGQG